MGSAVRFFLTPSLRSVCITYLHWQPRTTNLAGSFQDLQSLGAASSWAIGQFGDPTLSIQVPSASLQSGNILRVAKIGRTCFDC